MDVIIGIGSDLYGDDGVGERVIGGLAERPGLRTMAVHQLVPELATEVRDARRLLFVDARLDGSGVRLERIRPAAHRGLGHACPPEAFLEWARMLYDAAPQAWLLSVGGSSFRPGDGLSPSTEALIPEAIGRVSAWLDGDGSQGTEEEA